MALFPIYLVGSFPKPSYLKIPSWFDANTYLFSAQQYTDYLNKFKQSKQGQLSLQKAFDEVITEQIDLGCDIITDGEIDRENYIWHFCRYCLNGFDFNHPQKITARNGATSMFAPRIISKITLNEEALDFMGDQWLKLQQRHDAKPIKIAIPGAMTIMDTTYNEYYAHDTNQLLFDLAKCINEYIVNLTTKFKVKYIQIDEPLFTRKPEMAKNIGFQTMKVCWQNVPDDVYKCVHLCCGYTNEVDNVEYKKAGNHAYVRLMEYGMDSFLADECGVNGISIEDAHDRVPMVFFKLVKKLDVILGVIKVCQTDMISKKEIVQRVNDIVKFGEMKPTKLWLAPDCGLAMLPIDAVRNKMKTLYDARNELRSQYQAKL
eukprot:267557_1